MIERTLALSLAAVVLLSGAASAQLVGQDRTVHADAYFLDAWYGEDPIFDSQTQSTALPGIFDAEVSAEAGGLGSSTYSTSRQYSEIDAANAWFYAEGAAAAGLYVQGTGNVNARSDVRIALSLSEPGTLFLWAGLSTSDTFDGFQSHDRPGEASVEVRIEDAGTGAILFEEGIEFGDPSTGLDEEILLPPGNYRLIAESIVHDQTLGVDQVNGSMTAGFYSLEGYLEGGGEPDAIPPAAPTGLVATAGNHVVALDWADNTEADLDEYAILRATTAGGPYTEIDRDTPSSYSDPNVTNGVTYYYVVAARDLAGNQSAFSNQATATPVAPPPPQMHVHSIVLSTTGPKQNRRGVATIKIVNESGAGVSGATVSGTFSGSFTGTYFGTTNSTGTVVLTSSPKNVQNPVFGFCVANVTHGALVYDATDNVETCDNYPN